MFPNQLSYEHYYGQQKKKSLLIKNLGMGLTFLSLAACSSDECAECHVTTEINGLDPPITNELAASCIY